MSHIVTIKTEIRDLASIESACRRLALPAPVAGAAKLFSSTAEGIIVRLPDWSYPIVCDTSTGQVHYDNYNGYWGQQKELDRFLQAYAVERTKLEARRRGHSVQEQTLTDGSIKLTVQVGGAA